MTCALLSNESTLPMDAWLQFTASYLCKRFVTKPQIENETVEQQKEVWIKTFVSCVWVYDIFKGTVVSVCHLDTKPKKMKEHKEMSTNDQEMSQICEKISKVVDQEAFRKHDRAVTQLFNLQWNKSQYVLLHCLEDHRENQMSPTPLATHILIFQKEATPDEMMEDILVLEVDRVGNPLQLPKNSLQFLTFLVISQHNRPHHIVALQNEENLSLLDSNYLVEHFLKRVLPQTAAPPLYAYPRCAHGVRSKKTSHGGGRYTPMSKTIHFGWILLPYLVAIRRYLCRLLQSSNGIERDPRFMHENENPNLLNFTPQEWKCHFCASPEDCPTQFRCWQLHYVSTSLSYETFFKGFLAYYIREKPIEQPLLQPESDTKNASLSPSPPIISSLSSSSSSSTSSSSFFSSRPPLVYTPAPAPRFPSNVFPNLYPYSYVNHQSPFNTIYPYFYPPNPPILPAPTPSAKKKKRTREKRTEPLPFSGTFSVPEEVSSVFEFIIQEILLSSFATHPLIPINPKKEMINTEYDLINRVWQFLSRREETKQLALHRGRIAVIVAFTLRDMVRKKSLKQSKYDLFSTLYPHLFPIRFLPNSIQLYIYETLCSYTVFQLLGTKDHNPVLTFHIQSALDPSYPTFKGQTSTELILSLRSRAQTEGRQDILLEKDVHIDKIITDMVQLGILSTNSQFSI